MVKGLLDALTAQGSVSEGQGVMGFVDDREDEVPRDSDHRPSLSAMEWQDGAATVEGAVATVTLF